MRCVRTKKNNNNKGYSTLETLVYVAIFIVIAAVTVDNIFGIARSFARAKVYNELKTSAVVVMDRMIREIRNGTSVDIGTSVFDTDPGHLRVNTVDDMGTPKVVEFDFEGNDIFLIENAVNRGSLIGAGVEVTSLIFRFSSTTRSELVRIEMVLDSLRTDSIPAQSFSASAVLRGTY